MKKLILTGIIVSMFATSALAAPVYKGVNERQENQKERITNGYKQGELTKAETANLIHDQRQINRAEKRMRADDGLNTKERIRLGHMQNSASREIYRKNHNDRTR